MSRGLLVALLTLVLLTVTAQRAAAGDELQLEQPGAPASTLAAARTAAARPSALAALAAMDPRDLASKAGALGRTPQQLRDLIAGSSAVTFEPGSGALLHRCDFGGAPAPGDPAALALPGPPPGGAPAAYDYAAELASLPGDGGDGGGGGGGGAGGTAPASQLAEPGTPDPDKTLAFKLHSRPGAPKTIYLDFNGHTTTGTHWNRAPCPNANGAFCHSKANQWPPSFSTPAFSTDSDPRFSATELGMIVAIWRSVAEDFSPWDVDVTTEEPTFSLAGTRGTRVAIGGSDLDWYSQGQSVSQAAGTSFTNVWGNGDWGAGYPSGGNEVLSAYVFSKALGNDVKKVWEAISHEVGHALGLAHHGRAAGDGKPAEEYYEGHTGASAADWAPIMGSAYGYGVTQWCRGDYARASRPAQDDAAVISATLPPAPDDAPGSAGPTAALIPNAGAPGGAAVSGVIGRGDVDVFRFAAGPGALALSVALTDRYGSRGRSNLDLEVTLRDGGGAALKAWHNDAGLLQGGLEPVDIPSVGTYYLEVAPVGQGMDASVGRTSYGSMGQYRLSVAAQPTEPTGVSCRRLTRSFPVPTPGGACDGAVIPPEELFAANGSAYAVNPALPRDNKYLPGTYSYEVRGTSGSCSVTFSVVASPACEPRVTCRSGARVVALRPGAGAGCSGAALPETELFNGGAPAAVSPPLPSGNFFTPAPLPPKLIPTKPSTPLPPPLSPPGKASFTATAANGTNHCRFRVDVRPCQPLCVTPPPVLRTAPGRCAANQPADPGLLLQAASLGSAVSSVTFKGGPIGPGPRKVSAVVRYAGGATARASCAVTVADAQPPAAAPRGACAFPRGPPPADGERSERDAACFDLDELAVASDNCRGGLGLVFINCSVAGNGSSAAPSGASGAAANATAAAAGALPECWLDAESGRVCVRYPANPAGAPALAAARVALAAVDGARLTSAPIVAQVTAWSRKLQPAPAGCQGR
ncbi:MAG: hypothetical protein J3K34DRAFT_455570 [Monoraphidium minutum]|nr:MAG: hypothetical protein J3K34DRAFT_455570 [Monoraphidium minutum]